MQAEKSTIRLPKVRRRVLSRIVIPYLFYIGHATREVGMFRRPYLNAPLIFVSRLLICIPTWSCWPVQTIEALLSGGDVLLCAFVPLQCSGQLAGRCSPVTMLLSGDLQEEPRPGEGERGILGEVGGKELPARILRWQPMIQEAEEGGSLCLLSISRGSISSNSSCKSRRRGSVCCEHLPCEHPHARRADCAR